MTLPAQDIVERLRFHGRYASESQDECTARKNAEREEAAETISRLTADNEALRKERDEAIAKRESADGRDGAVVHDIREVLYASEVPVAPFIDDHVVNAIVQRDQARARVTALEADVGRLKAALEAAREVVDICAGENRASYRLAHEVRDKIIAALGGSDHG